MTRAVPSLVTPNLHGTRDPRKLYSPYPQVQDQAILERCVSLVCSPHLQASSGRGWEMSLDRSRLWELVPCSWPSQLLVQTPTKSRFPIYPRAFNRPHPSCQACNSLDSQQWVSSGSAEWHGEPCNPAMAQRPWIRLPSDALTMCVRELAIDIAVIEHFSCEATQLLS